MNCRSLVPWLLAAAALAATDCSDLSSSPTRHVPSTQAKRLIAYSNYDCDGPDWWCRDTYLDQIIANLHDSDMNSYCLTYPDTCTFTINGGGGYANPTVPDALADPNDGLPLETPNCSSPQDQYERAWCGGYAPAGGALARINTAISRIRSVGGVCSTLADILTAVVGRGDLHLYDGTGYNFGGAAPVGGGSTGSSSWIALDNYWTGFAYDGDHLDDTGRDLQSALAHEADHLNGEAGHVGSNGQNTTNSQHCGGL